MSDSAWSDDGSVCSTVDLRAPGYSMENVKVTHQGDLGTCYAHAAVKAYEAKLKASGQVDGGFEASVFAAFVRNTDKNEFMDKQYLFKPAVQNRHVAFGDFCSLIQQLKSRGVCDAREFESALPLAMKARSFHGVKNLIWSRRLTRAKSADLLHEVEKRQLRDLRKIPITLEEFQKLQATFKAGKTLASALRNEKIRLNN